MRVRGIWRGAIAGVVVVVVVIVVDVGGDGFARRDWMWDAFREGA